MCADFAFKVFLFSFETMTKFERNKKTETEIRTDDHKANEGGTRKKSFAFALFV